MKKECVTCQHLIVQRRGGEPIGHSCVGQAGKRWAPSAAAKKDRCGPTKVWWAARR